MKENHREEKMIGRSILDAFLVGLIGIIIGLTFNYARRDGIPFLKNSDQERSIQSSREVSSGEGNAVEPVWIELEEAIQLYEEGKAIFVDARPEEEYQEGHIQGAVNVPYGWFLEEHPDLSYLLHSGKTIVTYCGGEECEASVELAYAMWERGYSGIKIFFGGWNDWTQENLPIEKDHQK